MSRGLFITGTGTDVGKTYVTALLVKKLREAGLKAGYYKAAISGAEKRGASLWAGDAMLVNEIAGIGAAQSELVSYVYEEAVSPHLAAKLNNQPIELCRLRQDYHSSLQKYDYLTVEGSGGIVCPLRYDDVRVQLEDIVKEFKLPTLIVADAGLGTINSVVLTAEYIKNHGMSAVGIILNNYHADSVMERDNKYMITELTGLPVIAEVGTGDSSLAITAEELQKYYSEVAEA